MEHSEGKTCGNDKAADNKKPAEAGFLHVAAISRRGP
jgi:hypothetical protein